MKHTEMLKHGSNRFEKKVDVSRDTSKSAKEVAKEAGVSKHSKMLTVGDNQYSNEGVQRCTPKSSKDGSNQ